MAEDPRGTLAYGETIPSIGARAPRISGEHCGRVIGGRYKLLKVIGSGGMGEIYLGEHTKLGTPIAVKTMHPHIAAQPDMARRFGREAHAISRLRHPNIVHILDYGDDGGLLYIVMELLEGISLRAWLAQQIQPPPLEEASSILAPVLDALACAHEAGIVHRDLKPENIFLAEVNGARILKLLDFGLAHVEDPRDAGPTLTKSDVMGGTPEYMSPEQCRSLVVGPSADLYSVGCILTALLQLEPPFFEGSAMDIITKHMFFPPPPLARPPGAATVPPLLESLRLDLLAKSPAMRPRDAQTVKARLLEALSSDAAQARLPPRKSDEPLGSRAQRAPAWDSAPPAQRLGAGMSAGMSAGPSAGDAAVGLLRLGLAGGAGEAGEAGVGSSCATGLAAQSLFVKEARDAKQLLDFELGAAILDAGPLVADACECLRTIAAARPALRVVVCIDKPGIDAINALIAAGAADVMTYPVSSDRLGRKLLRLIRRGR